METSSRPKIKIGLVDDHQLFSKSLSLLLATFKNFEVVVDAIHGKDLQAKLTSLATVPDIMLIDVSMPVMDGPQTATWLRQAFPKIRLVALSMSDNQQTIIQMLMAGCCAYLFKDTHPDVLEQALEEVNQFGYYNPAIKQQNSKGTEWNNRLQLSDNELEFLKLACSDLTYKQVAHQMKLSERTIDGYREALFEKLQVQSRTGMALEAIRRGLVKL